MNEAVIISNMTLILLVVLKIALEMVQSRRRKKTDSDSFYPTDRKVCQNNKENIVKLCIKDGIEPEV